ncbi:MAG: acyl-[ACP]--phospholipid O-acyltransferase [Cellvibrionaceae bacterium]|nr:acyl-[ACP]--phospholipid O-acyltransferase [Cellvibrionaceae bacterium]
MKKLRHFTGAIPFFTAVFLNAFVDLGHKIVIQNTVFKLYDGPPQIMLTALVNSLILLPFILLLNPAGFLSDKFRKTEVMRLSAWAAVACTVLITLFYYLGWFWAAFAMTFLLAAQSAIYSPAKYGYIKEMFGKERLGEGNGVVSALSIVAILAGIFVYSVLFETGYRYAGGLESEAEVLRAIAPIGFLLILNSLVEVVMMYRLPEQLPTGVTEQFSWSRYLTGRTFKEDIRPLSRSRVIRLSVIGLATFWAVGQVMLAAFPAFYKETLGNDNTILVQGILACSGIGIALGSMFAGKFSRNYIETGLLPLGALGIAIGLWLLPGATSGWAFAAIFLFVGFAGGVFIVPLNSLIQYYAGEHELGKTLAANNWVQNMVMLSFLILTAVFAYFGWSSKTLLMLIAVVAVIGCVYVVSQLPQSLMRFLLGYLLSRRYKVAVQGMKNIPTRGGVLLLGNHVSWIDWAILQLACPRPLRFVMLRSIYQRWYLKWFFDLFRCIPIESGPRSRKALTEVAEALNRGDVVCLFPEGTISRTGHLADFRRGYERACEQVNDDVVIVPFYLRGLWGSQFSRSSARLKANSSLLNRDLIVAFGAPLPKSTTADVLKRRVFDLSITSWNEHVKTLPTISRAWIASAKKTGSNLALADFTMDRELSGNQALAGSLILARRVRPKKLEQNIGVLLPTSAAGALMNMAVLLAGKTIVNLNYTASREALEQAINQAGIRTIYTSNRFMRKLEARGIHLQELFMDLDVVDLEQLNGAVPVWEKLLTFIGVLCTPGWLLKTIYTSRQNSQDTAAILFSSGSEGAPKGVMLSHENIVANVKQVAEVLNMEDRDAIIANLPLFHAFGLTITQFLPLLEGCPMICHADPTDALGCAKAIARYRATIMCGTSTFLRLYCRNHKVQPLMLDSLRVVVAGAEKLSEDVRTAFQLKFNKPLFEGYGATETTPVASVNLPDKMETQTFQVQRGNKSGSVGMPLPGTSCMIVDPETFVELPTGEAGMILIGGAQVMQGYLNNAEKTASVIKEIYGTRWYITGDKGYIDEDGYLFIVDRYSRFAKIAGEMVSLGAVENVIRALLDDAEKEVIIVALPDAKKGEKLVALHNFDLQPESLKPQMLNAGLNPLALPSEWFRLESLPKLGSGKTDFGKAKQLAIAESSR